MKLDYIHNDRPAARVWVPVYLDVPTLKAAITAYTRTCTTDPLISHSPRKIVALLKTTILCVGTANLPTPTESEASYATAVLDRINVSYATVIASPQATAAVSYPAGSPQDSSQP